MCTGVGTPNHIPLHTSRPRTSVPPRGGWPSETRQRECLRCRNRFAREEINTMSDSELAVIEDQLRGAPDFSKMPIDEMRKTIDAMADGTPSDPSIRYEQIKLGHVPVEVGLAPGSRLDHSLL